MPGRSGWSRPGTADGSLPRWVCRTSRARLASGTHRTSPHRSPVSRRPRWSTGLYRSFRSTSVSGSCPMSAELPSRAAGQGESRPDDRHGTRACRPGLAGARHRSRGRSRVAHGPVGSPMTRQPSEMRYSGCWGTGRNGSRSHGVRSRPPRHTLSVRGRWGGSGSFCGRWSSRTSHTRRRSSHLSAPSGRRWLVRPPVSRRPGTVSRRSDRGRVPPGRVVSFGWLGHILSSYGPD